MELSKYLKIIQVLENMHTQELCDFLKDNPRASTKDIIKVLGITSTARISQIIRAMTETDLLDCEVKKREKFYTLSVRYYTIKTHLLNLGVMM